jgi:hypothetical protein
MARSWSFKPNKIHVALSKKGAARGLAVAAELILGAAQAKVPIEEGTLERSGAASVDEENLRAAVSFDTPYAVKQHEDMTLHHDAGRSAKYLENAFNENLSAVQQVIAAEIRKELGGGRR